MPSPSNPQALNRYSYVRNNPLNFVDPTGHACAPIGKGARCTDMGRMDTTALHVALDVAGLADPTPISDGTNALLYAAEGNWEDAGLSAVAMVPYAGDAVAKPIKAAKYVAKAAKYADKTITTAQRAIKLLDDIKIAKQLIRETRAEGKVIVLGRTMNPRVSQIAEKLGGAAKFDAPPGLSGEELWRANASWLRDGIAEGYVIVDAGADIGRAPLGPGQIDFYARESELLSDLGYHNSIKLDVPPTGSAYDDFWKYFQSLDAP